MESTEPVTIRLTKKQMTEIRQATKGPLARALPAIAQSAMALLKRNHEAIEVDKDGSIQVISSAATGVSNPLFVSGRNQKKPVEATVRANIMMRSAIKELLEKNIDVSMSNAIYALFKYLRTKDAQILVEFGSSGPTMKVNFAVSRAAA